MEKWLEILSTYGVAFVGLVALAVYVVKKDSEHREDISKLRTEQTESINSITEALNNNTLAITKLCERIGKGD